ncbi:indole-3-glycerol phosphate synthase TrpC [Methanobacterium paludis]|uniref:Indole-3-glycerol phosphate synthase n=1 Tax=Methanobacterium paludis (strain DSM 25820 / JCM 18151 / SWAN1) TaxID=868131 RepID=F6D5L3_METPW|nr:indole-3-glycerol-phosphate synthase [Methanobacterium paludis]AEG17630.1 Indole-3-glycerol-phosphate synthase [Methanobacterium paludis]
MIQIQDIISQRRKDLQKTMEIKPLKDLKSQFEDISDGSKGFVSRSKNPLKTENLKTRNPKNAEIFKDSITHEENVCVICEYKPASPSMGDISSAPIKDALDVFGESGASAVSILTEKNFFKGSLNNLKSASKITELPLLRKDFVLDEYQIYEAKLAGASAVLLICGVYPDLSSGINLCNDLGIDALVECKNRVDIEGALKAGAQIIGINNRNFEDFTIDLKKTQKLAGYVPPEIVLVSESGVKTPDDAKLLASYGADAILIGTGIMGENNKSKMFEAANGIINVLNGSKVERTSN